MARKPFVEFQQDHSGQAAYRQQVRIQKYQQGIRDIKKGNPSIRRRQSSR